MSNWMIELDKRIYCKIEHIYPLTKMDISEFDLTLLSQLVKETYDRLLM